MRILLAAHQFFPDSYTGTENLVCQLAKQLIQMGHSVVVFAAKPMRDMNDKPYEIFAYKYENIRVNRISVPNFKRDKKNPMLAEYYNPHVRRPFRQLLKVFNPDLVHFFHFRNITLACADECNEAGIPTVFTPTDFWFACPTIQLLLPDHSICSGPHAGGENCLRHLIMERTEGLMSNCIGLIPDTIFRLPMAVSHILTSNLGVGVASIKALGNRSEVIRDHLRQMKRICIPSRTIDGQMRRFSPHTSNIQFIPFGIDFPKPLMSSKKITQMRVGFIGTLSRHKGAHVLLEAISELSPELPVEIHVFGSENEVQRYSSLLRRLAGDDQRIHFDGGFSPQEINRVFAEIDLLVIPSIWLENIPLVAYAAQYYGCPVLGSNTAGLNEMIKHGDNGLLFEPGCSNSLAAHIKLLCEDRDKLKQLEDNITKPRTILDFAGDMQQIYLDITN